MVQKGKQLDFYKVPIIFDNPKIIFCYSHRLNFLCSVISNFQNNFILITHNSDENITTSNMYVENLLSSTRIIKWYAQNLSVFNSKISPLPIGIANSQWKHGNIENLRNIKTIKTDSIFFNFTINTNAKKRTDCYNKLINKIPFINKLDQEEYYKTLGRYKFCICPEGNGYDTHRLWEALYLRCVPIVLKTEFMIILKTHMNIPLFMVESWDNLEVEDLIYEKYEFKDEYYDIETYKKIITS
jgi:hypothetical protein